MLAGGEHMHILILETVTMFLWLKSCQPLEYADGDWCINLHTTKNSRMKHTEIKENSQKNEDSVFFMVFVNGYDCSLLHIGIILF